MPPRATFPAGWRRRQRPGASAGYDAGPFSVHRGPPMITTPSGLQYEDTVVGSGAEARAGQHVSVHYTGWLYDNGTKGAKFDSSKDRNDPFDFGLGGGQVIKGWDEGVQGM